MALSQSGDRLAYTWGISVILIDALTGDELWRTVAGCDSRSLVFSRDSRYIGRSDSDWCYDTSGYPEAKGLEFFEAATGTGFYGSDLENNGFIGLAFHPSRPIAIAGTEPVQIISVPSATRVATFDTRGYGFRFNEDGSILQINHEDTIGFYRFGEGWFEQ